VSLASWFVPQVECQSLQDVYGGVAFTIAVPEAKWHIEIGLCKLSVPEVVLSIKSQKVKLALQTSSAITVEYGMKNLTPHG